MQTPDGSQSILDWFKPKMELKDFGGVTRGWSVRFCPSFARQTSRGCTWDTPYAPEGHFHVVQRISMLFDDPSERGSPQRCGDGRVSCEIRFQVRREPDREISEATLQKTVPAVALARLRDGAAAGSRREELQRLRPSRRQAGVDHGW